MSAAEVVPKDPQSADFTLAVVGTGMMGRGIAQVVAQAGIRVLLHDSAPAAVPAARDSVAGALAKLVEKGRLSAADAEKAVSRLEVASELQALARCDLVVEAIIENVEAKRELFARLEGIVGANCVLASNTSTLSITAIAAGCKRPERVAGLHFFNPVPLMKVVEVVDGALTAPIVGETLCALVRRIGHRAVRAKDSPGFIINHAGRGFGPEALRMLGEGIAEFWEIDRVLRECAGFRMGPFELFDLVGLDVSHAVIENIYRQYYDEPRYRPSSLTAPRVAAGLVGRKAGRGFYRYEKGVQETMPVAAAPAWADHKRPVWISARGLGASLKELAARLGAAVEDSQRPGEKALCLVAPIGEDTTTAALAEGLDPARTVAVDCLFPLEKHRTLMTTPVTGAKAREAAHALFASDGAGVTIIHDSPGFVCQRVVAQIVNVATDMAQQRIATPQDIDLGVTLGLGYPKGPLAWGDALGPPRVLEILNALHGFYGDPRYRPSAWLKRRAMLGVSLLTPEA